MGSIKSIEELRLNEGLCHKFRKTVMKSNEFKAICSSLEQKNKMNVIYSTMDWLNVAVEGINSIDFKINGLGYNHQNTLKVTQYIISIDLILESIKQIYRVIEDVFSLKYPFNKTSHIFEKETLSDEDYFKHLRAIFGVHPVNLNSIDGIENKRNSTRYFASWVAYSTSKEYDFEVSIYGNNIDEDLINIFGISLFKVNQFVSERYDLLNDVIVAIRSLETTKVESFKGKVITLGNRNIIEDLNILLHENNQRFEYYAGYQLLIEYMLDCFGSAGRFEEITFEKSILDNYLKRLEELLPIIKVNLENMKLINIHVGIVANGYEFEKITQYLYYGQNEVGEEYFRALIDHSDLPKEFKAIEDFKLYRLVYDAFLYSRMSRKDFVIYKELLRNESIYINKGSIGFTGYRL